MKEEDLLLMLLEESIQKCYDEPDSLIKQTGQERALCSCIHYYMQLAINNDPKFCNYKDLSVDCEYNKAINAPKATISKPNGSRPDIILHKRGTHDENKLVVEFKFKTNDNIDSAIEKLNDDKLEYCYFQHGKKIVTSKQDINSRHFDYK
jgi:hypothetical protein